MDPDVVMLSQKRYIFFDHLQGDRLDLIERHVKIKPGKVQRALQTLKMLPEFVRTMPKGTAGIKHRITKTKAPVEHRYGRLTCWDKVAVDVDNGFAHLTPLAKSLCQVTQAPAYAIALSLGKSKMWALHASGVFVTRTPDNAITITGKEVSHGTATRQSRPGEQGETP